MTDRRLTMNFELTKEQIMIRTMVRDFAEAVIKPRAIEIDREAKFPEDIFQQMGKLGLMGIPFPEEYGGSGGDTISYALAVEEIGKVCGSTGLSYRSEEHTSELQSRGHLVCRLLLEKKKTAKNILIT